MKPVWIGIMKSSGSHYFDDGKEVSSFRCLYKSNFVLNPNPLSYKAISNLFGVLAGLFMNWEHFCPNEIGFIILTLLVNAIKIPTSE